MNEIKAVAFDICFDDSADNMLSSGFLPLIIICSNIENNASIVRNNLPKLNGYNELGNVKYNYGFNDNETVYIIKPTIVDYVNVISQNKQIDQIIHKEFQSDGDVVLSLASGTTVSLNGTIEKGLSMMAEYRKSNQQEFQK